MMRVRTITLQMTGQQIRELQGLDVVAIDCSLIFQTYALSTNSNMTNSHIAFIYTVQSTNMKTVSF